MSASRYANLGQLRVQVAIGGSTIFAFQRWTALRGFRCIAVMRYEVRKTPQDVAVGRAFAPMLSPPKVRCVVLSGANSGKISLSVGGVRVHEPLNVFICLRFPDDREHETNLGQVGDGSILNRILPMRVLGLPILLP